jgi:hypothetical protein
LGIGDWAQSPIPNPQSPIPNPQSPIPIIYLLFEKKNYQINNFLINKNLKIIKIIIIFFDFFLTINFYIFGFQKFNYIINHFFEIFHYCLESVHFID